MRRGKTIIALFTICFLAVILLCLGMLPREPETPIEEQEAPGFSVTVEVNGAEETLTPLRNDRGEYCIYLPGYARMDQVFLKPDRGYRLSLQGSPLEEKTSAELFQREQPQSVTVTDSRGRKREVTLIFLQNGSIPAMYVDVHSGNMRYIHSNKENEEQGTMRIYTEDGSLSYSGSLEAVKGRGNATWDWEKKPYNLKLRSSADLLGMGEAANWVLLANTYDPSHIRNTIVYETAARIGLSYSPQCRWVDLYLNGEYAGLYLLCEKNELAPERVPLDIGSGNLISIEKQDRLWEYSNSFLTEGGTPIRIRSTPDTGAVQETLNQLERAILAQNGMDPETGALWTDLLDLESWAKKYLIEEVFGNLDAGSISQFFYWENGGKIYAGPVWDYDVSMGNSRNWQLQNVNMLYSGRPHLWNTQDTPWYYALSQKEVFHHQVVVLYKEQLRPLLTQLIAEDIPAYTERIRQSAATNALRWDTEDPQAEAEAVQSYLKARMEFLDALWLEEKEFYLVQLYINWHVMACYAIEPGQCLPYREVPAGSDTIVYLGWYDAKTDSLYDFSQPVTEDTMVYLKEAGDEDTPAETGGGGLSARIRYLPLAGLLTLLTALLAAEKIRHPAPTKHRRQHDRAETDEIPT